MASTYGADSYCIDDIQLISTIVTDPVQLVAQRLVRRWTTQRGALALINGDPDFGFDCRQFINAKLTPQQVQEAASILQKEGLKDQEIETLNVTLTLSQNNVSISATGTLATGPFDLTLDIGQVTASLLINGGQ